MIDNAFTIAGMGVPPEPPHSPAQFKRRCLDSRRRSKFAVRQCAKNLRQKLDFGPPAEALTAVPSLAKLWSLRARWLALW